MKPQEWIQAIGKIRTSLCGTRPHDLHTESTVSCHNDFVVIMNSFDLERKALQRETPQLVVRVPPILNQNAMDKVQAYARGDSGGK